MENGGLKVAQTLVNNFVHKKKTLLNGATQNAELRRRKETGTITTWKRVWDTKLKKKINVGNEMLKNGYRSAGTSWKGNRQTLLDCRVWNGRYYAEILLYSSNQNNQCEKRIGHFT